jgi:cyclopropane fatty-acyl-phospholipid synthase-like methyltransferase
MRNKFRLWGKRLLFPGLDLHTRCRYRFLPKFFLPGSVDTLDAGCGNGALSYAAYRLGNRVLGVTMDAEQVEKARAFFSFRGADLARLQFAACNLYDLPKLDRKFDQIICSETLEHIARDREVVQHFRALLRDGGVLHLSCPFSEHPLNHGQVCEDEKIGWHVRDGYTLQTYRALLEPEGFRIVKSAGLGSPLLVSLDTMIRSIWNRRGIGAALPLFLLTWPLQRLDYLDPPVPLSLYVQAVKTPDG